MRPAAGRACVSVALAAATLAAGGCDVDGGPDQRVDAPATPPPDWVSVASRSGRFTFAVPKQWRVERQAKEVAVRAPTLDPVVSLRADRSPAGQRTPAREYAFEILENLPGFKGRVVKGPRTVSGSPYGNARVSAVGELTGSARRQRVSVVALRIPDQVTYVATVYGGAEAPATDQIIRTVRSGLGRRN